VKKRAVQPNAARPDLDRMYAPAPRDPMKLITLRLEVARVRDLERIAQDCCCTVSQVIRAAIATECERSKSIKVKT